MSLAAKINYAKPFQAKNGELYFDTSNNTMQVFDGTSWINMTNPTGETIKDKLIKKEDLLKWYNKEYCREQIDIDEANIIYCKCDDISFWDYYLSIDGSNIKLIDVKKYPTLYNKYILNEY